MHPILFQGQVPAAVPCGFDGAEHQLVEAVSFQDRHGSLCGATRRGHATPQLHCLVRAGGHHGARAETGYCSKAVRRLSGQAQFPGCERQSLGHQKIICRTGARHRVPSPAPRAGASFPFPTNPVYPVHLR